MEEKENTTASNFISLILIIMLYWSISTFFTNSLKIKNMIIYLLYYYV